MSAFVSVLTGFTPEVVGAAAVVEVVVVVLDFLSLLQALMPATIASESTATPRIRRAECERMVPPGGLGQFRLAER
jgi:hypothetical protein